ncbi:hypothetical protein Tco_1314913 [Tanacetum coccineum]
MLIRGVSLLNSKLETECYLRYLRGKEWYDLVRKESWHHDWKIEIDENLRFVEEPIEIVERDVKKLKRRRIPLVKVRWNSRQGAEYTWEREDQFRKKYPNLFSEPVPSSVRKGAKVGYYSSSPSIHHQSKTKGFSKLDGKIDYSSDHKHDGRVRFVKSSTLIGSLKLRGYAAGRKAQGDVDFTLKALTQQKQGHIKGLPAWQSM